MNRQRMTIVAAALLALGWGVPTRVEAQANKSDQRTSGEYEVVKDWPKHISTWPGHEGWTWGSTQGIFAQNPDRIFIVQRGELRALKHTRSRDNPRQIIEVEGVEGTVRLSAPAAGVPPRNPSIDPLGSPGEPNVPHIGEAGRDYRWEHILFVVDSAGNLVEEWTQWDSLFKRAHKVRISPYDPEKRVWVIDDGNNAIFVFSNDGKELLMTVGTPGEKGDDESHFWRQTDIAWLPDGTFFVSDGYDNTRVVKFDKDGKFIKAWGKPGEPGGNEMRPNFFNTVHGMAIDNERRVYVVDRSNRRIQIFDEQGGFLDHWYLGDLGATYDILITADQHLWLSDGHGNYKIYKYALDGTMLHSWGTWGSLPGSLWGAHQMSVDQQGNLYVAEVFNGRAQKFRPREGANPDYLVGKPAYPTWQD